MFSNNWDSRLEQKSHVRLLCILANFQQPASLGNGNVGKACGGQSCGSEPVTIHQCICEALTLETPAMLKSVALGVLGYVASIKTTSHGRESHVIVTRIDSDEPASPRSRNDDR
jgi:hypothetical protein